MGRWRRIYFMTPTFFPAGGVVKLFDYVNHAISLGYEPVIAAPNVRGVQNGYSSIWDLNYTSLR